MSSNAINLRLVNQSNDSSNSMYVIFQKNVATSFEEVAVAWKVVKNLGIGDYHPFQYTYGLQVSAGDSNGNFTPNMSAENGLMYQLVPNSSGHQLVQSGVAAGPNEIDLLNNLNRGAIDANCYRSGKLVATKTSLAPRQKAVFEFKPYIYIGVASQVEEGEIMNSAVISNINTEISLLGIVSADIVITGGGPGTQSTEFKFTLQNVKYA
jgi:hypothetical protein